MLTIKDPVVPHDLYETEVTPDGQNSLSRIARMIKKGAEVLDVGTGPGALGRFLATKGCTLDGIERDPARVALARPFYRTLHELDLETADLAASLGTARYDVVVCADILEHLREPGRILDALTRRLRRGGRVLISVPNVAYAGLVSSLLAGEFPYHPTGILDQTHLRFFTRRSLLDFLHNHGLGVLSLEPTTCPVSDSEFRDHDPVLLPPELRDALLSPPDALSYQFVVEAAPGVETPAAVASPSPRGKASHARLYWSFGESECTEALSAADTSTASRQLLFALPRFEVPPHRLRLDVTDRPGFFRITQVTLRDPVGSELWNWWADEITLAATRSQQLLEAALEGQRWWFATGDDPAVDLPIPSPILDRCGECCLIVDVEFPSSGQSFLAPLTFSPRVKALADQAAETAQRVAAAARALARLETGPEGGHGAGAAGEKPAPEPAPEPATSPRPPDLDGRLALQAEALADLSTSVQALQSSLASRQRRVTLEPARLSAPLLGRLRARAGPQPSGRPSLLRRAAREARRALRPIRCELVAEPMLELAPGPVRLRLTPRKGRLPAGWVVVDFELSSEDGERLMPRLLVADIDGRIDDSPTPLPPLVDGRSRGLVKLNDFVTGLFLEPMAEEGSFRVGTLSITEISRLEAAPRLAVPMIASRAGRPRELYRILTDAYQSFRAEGWPALKHHLRDQAVPPAPRSDYQSWIRTHDQVTAADRAEIHGRCQELEATLGFTVVLLASATDTQRDVDATVRSLKRQLYQRWTGIVACSEAPPAHLQTSLGADPRWSWPPVTSGAELSRRAEGLVAFVRPGEQLAAQALYVMAEGFERNPGADLIYPDEDLLRERRRAEPFFKPDWSPYRLWCQDYVRHRFACRAEFLKRGHLPDDLQGEPLFELLLDAQRLGTQVVHVPFVLYHLGRQQPRDLSRARAVLERHVAALAPGATVKSGFLPETFHVALPLPATPPKVSILIPTRNRADLLRRCIETLRAHTDYPDYEIVVVDNDSDEASARLYLQQLQAQGIARVVGFPGSFNFAAINNFAARSAAGSVLVLLNNDIEVPSPGWLREMVGWALRDDVGAVGCRLLFGDRRVQHAGVILGLGGLAGHFDRELGPEEPGYGGSAWTIREVGAVTAACLVLRRDLFQRVGGMDEALRVAFNDVDLCLKLRKDRLSVLYTPFAELLHLESASRGGDATPERAARTAAEAAHVRAKHGARALVDPFFSPNLSLEHTEPRCAFPPRVHKPWQPQSVDRPRVALLTYRLRKGYGVDVVVAEQLEYLCARGYQVAALVLEKDEHYDGRLALYLREGTLEIFCVRSQEEAVAKVLALGCEVAIAHTPPFHGVLPRLPASVFRVLFDHGEPPAHLFPDADERRRIAEEKVWISTKVDLSIAISEFIRADSGLHEPALCRNGNDHLLRRRSDLARLAGTFRRLNGLNGSFVVLNVTRYLKEERRYKGVEEFARLREALVQARPDLARKIRFVLAGRGEPADRAWAKRRGLHAVANLEDDQLLAAYLDSDLYVSTSQWEGYNLGVAQALALGVPTLASAKGAHPEFPIRTSDDVAQLAQWIVEEYERAAAAPGRADPLRRLRKAHVSPWRDSAARLEALVQKGLDERKRLSARYPRPHVVGAGGAPPEVSFVILNKDKPDLIAPCVRSIEEQCDVPFEILIGDTGSTDPKTLRFYEETRHQVHYLGFYNFSANNNVLAARAKGSHLVFLNNDTQLIRTQFREALRYLERNPKVGCLGAYLVYKDLRIQHAGVRICPTPPYRGIPEHFDRHKPIEGYPGLDRAREVVAVTGALVLMSAKRFQELDGFDEVFEEEAQDIDLCLRMRARGLKSVMHPALFSYHYENATRTVKEAPKDRAEFLRRYGALIEDELFAWQAGAGLG